MQRGLHDQRLLWKVNRAGKLLFALIPAMTVAACVSVSIGGRDVEKSKGVSYKEPASPFHKMDTSGADAAWLNRDNGNTISFLSTCNDPADPSLETVKQELLAGMQDTALLEKENLTFNGREALNTVVEGLIDGVKTRLQLLIFKKNNCIYSLSYVTLDRNFDTDRQSFRDFAGSFEAP